MYNFLISGAIACAAFAILMLVGLPWWGAVVIALLLFGGAFLLIARLVTKKVMAVMETATKDLQAQRVEKAIRELKEAFKYSRWQIYVEGQINSQIGTIYYIKRDFSNAFPYLEKSFPKNWVAMAMLGITYMKRNKQDKMKESFEKGVQWSGKESLLWSLYAYCWTECGDNGKAKEVLERGLKKLPGDPKLKENLAALTDGKKMKMRDYGEMWLQFHLERPGVIAKQAASLAGQKRRIIRR